MVGYDDREIAQFMRPPLTTVVLPHYEMGLQAAETLIDGHVRARRPPAADQGRMHARRPRLGGAAAPRS